MCRNLRVKQQDQSWSGAGTGSGQKAGKSSSSTGSPGERWFCGECNGDNNYKQNLSKRKAPKGAFFKYQPAHILLWHADHEPWRSTKESRETVAI